MRQTVAVHDGMGITLYSGTDEPDWSQAIDAAREAERMQGTDWEACGIIFRDSFGVKIKVLENIAKGPGEFDISAEDCFDVYEWLAEGGLVGIWHSHPNGHRQPSQRDWDNHPQGVAMYIVVLESDEEAMVLRYDDDSRPGKRPATDQ